ncbi:hypothetical protein [Phormidium sp. CCY1219]|uniref:hypothetical protein n=1 Tax=Phormidium sp. CCY1219 TaxID=2886104 RepID=UPI002D1EBDE4|nr:hypothetical protein [Phormidium sp. CCY1219]MEB3831949.1 hypothetical protein [Phormidium sp. CCY1219]
MIFTLARGMFWLSVGAVALTGVGENLAAIAQVSPPPMDEGVAGVAGDRGGYSLDSGGVDDESPTVATIAPPADNAGDRAMLLRGTQALNAAQFSAIDAHPFSPGGSLPPAPPEHLAIDDDDELDPGRTTLSGPSYVAAGLQVGINADNAASPLGDGGFALFSKIGLLEQVSLRPAVLFGEHVLFEVPVTIDFPLQDTDEQLRVNVAPYIGSGVAISTDSDNFIGFFGTAGIDWRLFSRFIATTGVKVGYVEDIEVGVAIGGGYAF